jgi:hypothetical protein
MNPSKAGLRGAVFPSEKWKNHRPVRIALLPLSGISIPGPKSRVIFMRRVSGFGTSCGKARKPVGSKISNALKWLGFRSRNHLAQRLSENLKSMYHPGSTIKFREAPE